MERLNKYLARCGVCSRRKADELIASGRVKVNGMVTDALGTKVSGNDVITVDGRVIEIQEYIYLAMNKPRGVLSSVSDDLGRKTVIDLLPQSLKNMRLFPIGRLDYDTKGILLLTNDGDFMNALIGPESNLEKEYLARVEGIVAKENLYRLTSGIKIDNYLTRPCLAYLDSTDTKNKSSSVRLIIKEGKYHQVKLMLEKIGHPVKRLTRIRFGEITCEGLGEGEVRFLTPHEIKRLYALSKRTTNDK